MKYKRGDKQAICDSLLDRLKLNNFGELKKLKYIITTEDGDFAFLCGKLDALEQVDLYFFEHVGIFFLKDINIVGIKPHDKINILKDDPTYGDLGLTIQTSIPPGTKS